MLKMFLGRYFTRLTTWWAILGSAIAILTQFLPQVATFVSQFTPAQAALFVSVGAALARARGVYNEVAAILGVNPVSDPQVSAGQDAPKS